MNRLIIFICVICVGVGSFILLARGGGAAGPAKKKPAAKYLGISACKKCHLKEYMSWKKTTMAKTLEVLKPGKGVETKKKFDLDPDKDYSTDPKCLPCHATGYGKPGGYVIAKSGDAKAKKQARENAGVTCEGCHGPGEKYIKLHQEVATRKRKYTAREFHDAGMYKMNAKACTSCHNPDNPTAPEGYKFDFEKEKDQGMHKMFPLKYRRK